MKLLINWLIFMGITLVPLEAASMQGAYRDGQTLVGAKANEVSTAVRRTAPGIIPGFTTATPEQVSINAHELSISAAHSRGSNPASSYFDASSANRQSYRFNQATDPLFRNADQAIANPHRTLEEDFAIEERVVTTETIEECEEGGEEFLKQCQDRLQVTVNITPAKKVLKGRTCPGHKKKSWCSGTRTCNPGCQEIYEHIPERVDINDHWLDGCGQLEAMMEAGLCSYEDVSHEFRGETRTINTKPITRDHWQKTKTYRCMVKPQNTCDRLLARGCIQVGSSCKETRGGVCVLWRQQYRCQNHGTNIQVRCSPGSRKPFCLGGDCQQSGYQHNTELFEAISYLSVLNQAQQDLRAYLDGRVFKGEYRHCRRNCVNFRDCCGNGKGWGVSLHLAQCSAEEKALGEQRVQKKCVNVGTYCSNRLLGVCLTKTTSFCCFGNKLSRILQEQGRRQLGLGWGSPAAPDCNGLTPEQLSRIDFSQIDFSEFYDDFKAQLQAKDANDGKSTIERLRDNLTSLQPTTPRNGLVTPGRGSL